MAGRPKNHDRWKPASGRQLWRLNQLGRLRLVDQALPIGSNEAKVLIAAEFASDATLGHASVCGVDDRGPVPLQRTGDSRSPGARPS
jgi:hypothetical protein